MARVLRALKATYPNKFNFSYRDDKEIVVAAKIFERQLHGIEWKYIAKALDECPKRYPSNVPEIGEFRKLCMEFVPANSKYVEYKSNPAKKTHDIQFEIAVMSRVAKKIKNIFFKNEKWDMKLACKISPLLNEIKIFANNYFFDRTHDDFFQEIDKFSDEDVKIALNFLEHKNE